MLWGTSDFLSRRASNQIGFYLAAEYMQLLSFCGLMIFALVTGGLGNFPQEIITNQGLFELNVIISIVNFVGITNLYRGFKTGNMALIAPIAAAYPDRHCHACSCVLGHSSIFDYSYWNCDSYFWNCTCRNESPWFSAKRSFCKSKKQDN